MEYIHLDNEFRILYFSVVASGFDCTIQLNHNKTNYTNSKTTFFIFWYFFFSIQWNKENICSPFYSFLERL